MGADSHRHHGRRPLTRRRWSAPAALTCGAVLLAGCASMPDSGDVSRVDSSPRSEVDTQVRVYGVSPGKNEPPRELVSGFLEATTSDEEHFDTAKQYLAERTADSWDPFAAITVLAEAPAMQVISDRDGEGVSVELTGTQLARVDSHHAYEPREKPYRQVVHLGRSGSEWRIDNVPEGLILVESDFQRLYGAVNKYYFAELGPDAQRAQFDDSQLVPDPVYLRRRIDPVTSTVKALLSGPTNWLDPVVRTAFPQGTRLADDHRLTLDDSDALKIRLRMPVRVDGERCRRMAAQVLFTVQDQASAHLNEVQLERANGSELCSLSRDEALPYDPETINGSAGHQYFIDAEHRMVRMADQDDKPQTVPGPFGADGALLRAVAVARDEQHAAGVSQDGRRLYVTDLTEGAERGPVRLHSRTGGEKTGLSVPSWDGLGGLWVADRDPDRPRLLRLQDGTGDLTEVRIPDLKGGRIASLRVSADGMRIVLLVKRGGHTKLLLGRIERAGSAERPELSVTGLRPIAPKLEDVDAVSWAAGNRLVVAGRETRGVQQLQYVETDGSPVNVPPPPSPNRAETLAASEAPDKPLIAQSPDGIVRLPLNGDWKTVSKDGTAPVYPG